MAPQCPAARSINGDDDLAADVPGLVGALGVGGAVQREGGEDGQVQVALRVELRQGSQPLRRTGQWSRPVSAPSSQRFSRSSAPAAARGDRARRWRSSEWKAAALISFDFLSLSWCRSWK